MKRLIVAVLILSGTACTVPSLDELYDCDSLKPADIAGGNADAVIDGDACTAIRVDIEYSGFRPGCIRLTIADAAEPANVKTSAIPIDSAARDGMRRVAVYGQKSWGRQITLTAQAHETSCSGLIVAAESIATQIVSASTIRTVTLNLQAEDQDQDGYVANAGPHPGTDCNDTQSLIHPGAIETCNGVDNNCSGDESDATDQSYYYADLDSDGYGNSTSTPELSCASIAGKATNSRDCDDSNSRVHPDQNEILCDGRDDDCNNAVDDGFDVGTFCTTASGCASTKVCSADGNRASCSSPDDNVLWYIDTDGDGATDLEGGRGCNMPPTANRQPTDCDPSSPYSAPGRTEVCDQIDNDCNGIVDDGAICDSSAWGAVGSFGGTGLVYNVVAPYARSKAWMAGDEDKLVHADGTSGTTTVADVINNCTGGGNWKAAWADSLGRVFLGSSNGKFTTRRLSDTNPCDIEDGPGTAPINGMVGFEQGTQRMIYSVDSQGRIIYWDYEAGTITEVTRVASNLKAIHGTSPNTLLAVGIDVSNVPAVWSPSTSGTGQWIKEELGNTGAASTLFAVQVLTPRLAYAVGEAGLFMERVNGTWTTRPAVTHPDTGSVVNVRALMAFSSKAMYVATSGSTKLQFFDGISWISVVTAPATINSLAGTSPGELWGVGGAGSLVRWQPGPP